MVDRFVNFTGRARWAVTHPQAEALRLNHEYIGTEHVLLSLIGDDDAGAARVLSRLGVDRPRVRQAIKFVVGRGERTIRDEDGLTRRARRVIELAVDESHRFGHDYIGTEHLLLGLVREGKGIGAGVLESVGVTLPRARSATMEVLSQHQGVAEAAARLLVEEETRAAPPEDPSAPAPASGADSATSKGVSLPELVDGDALTAEAARWLMAAIGRDAHMLIAGAPGTGKTTLLGALLAELNGQHEGAGPAGTAGAGSAEGAAAMVAPEHAGSGEAAHPLANNTPLPPSAASGRHERIITIDAPELAVPGDSVALMTRPPAAGAFGGLTVLGLLTHARLMRATRVVIEDVPVSDLGELLGTMADADGSTLVTLCTADAPQALREMRAASRRSAVGWDLLAATRPVLVQLEQIGDEDRRVAVISEVAPGNGGLLRPVFARDGVDRRLVRADS